MAEFEPFFVPTLDYLDVTFSPDDNPAELLEEFVHAHSLVPDTGLAPTAQAYRFVNVLDAHPFFEVEYGVLKVDTKYRAYRLSASGDFLATLRRRGLFNQYLTILASCPYRVTRLDAALDRQVDAATVLSHLDTLYPYEISLSRQRPLRTKMITSRRQDGQRSGTWYAGHRTRARVTARVYDKSLQILDIRGIDIGHKFTRYELTFKEGLTNLNDAYDPTGVFWAHIGSLLPLPQPLPEWNPSEVPAWTSTPVEVLPYEALLRRVSNSSELDLIISLAERLGPEWQNTLMHMLAQKMGLDVKGQYLGNRAA